MVAVRSSLLVLGLVALLGCGGGGDGGADEEVTPVTTGAEPDFENPWAVETVATGGVGRHVRLAVGADDVAHVAWYAMVGVAGEPCEAAGAQPPDEWRVALEYARDDGADGWTQETVDEVLTLGSTVGLDLALAPDGVPAIATMTGEAEPQIKYCGANDVGLYRRDGAGSWSVEIAAVESGEAETGEEGSDFGFVVGYWAAVAWDADGRPAVAYKDVHAGSIQADDFRRADLELAWQDGAGAWQHFAVDVGKGAGSYAAIVFDAEGRPNVLHHNATDDLITGEQGLWLARSADAGETWERVQLHVGHTTERPSLALDPADGSLWAAWYAPVDGVPRVAHLVDPDALTSASEGWTFEDAGSAQYDEGEHPSLAFAPDGTLALAYRRCRLAVDDGASCDAGEDAVVLAWRDGPAWEREVVDVGGAGSCGTHASLAFRSDGTPVVAYQCTEQTDDGEFEHVVRVATREPLP